MGRLERRLAAIAINLRPRFKITEAIRSALSNMRDRFSAPADLADLVVLENENRSLRKEIGELRAIILDMRMLAPLAARRAEMVAHHDLVSETPNAIPDSSKGLMSPMTPMFVLDGIIRERDDARRRLAALESRMSMARQSAQALLRLNDAGETGLTQKAMLMLSSLHQSLNGPLPMAPKPLPDSRWPENEPKFDGPVDAG